MYIFMWIYINTAEYIDTAFNDFLAFLYKAKFLRENIWWSTYVEVILPTLYVSSSVADMNRRLTLEMLIRGG